MKLSCVNISPNENAIAIINQIKKKSKKLKIMESKYFADSVVDLLERLANEDERLMKMDKIQKAFTHLAKSRKYLSYLDDSKKLDEIDHLIDEAISEISSEIIYLIDNLSEVEQW